MTANPADRVLALSRQLLLGEGAGQTEDDQLDLSSSPNTGGINAWMSDLDQRVVDSVGSRFAMAASAAP